MVILVGTEERSKGTEFWKRDAEEEQRKVTSISETRSVRKRRAVFRQGRTCNMKRDLEQVLSYSYQPYPFLW